MRSGRKHPLLRKRKRATSAASFFFLSLASFFRGLGSRETLSCLFKIFFAREQDFVFVLPPRALSPPLFSLSNSPFLDSEPPL